MVERQLRLRKNKVSTALHQVERVFNPAAAGFFLSEAKFTFPRHRDGSSIVQGVIQVLLQKIKDSMNVLKRVVEMK